MEEKLLWTSEEDAAWFVEQATAQLGAEFSHVCVVKVPPMAIALQYVHSVDGRTVIAISPENQTAWSHMATLELQPISERRSIP